MDSSRRPRRAAFAKASAAAVSQVKAEAVPADEYERRHDRASQAAPRFRQSGHTFVQESSAWTRQRRQQAMSRGKTKSSQARDDGFTLRLELRFIEIKETLRTERMLREKREEEMSELRLCAAVLKGKLPRSTKSCSQLGGTRTRRSRRRTGIRPVTRS